jgi:[acyl-carrier-protein] S-malonyltransferase
VLLVIQMCGWPHVCMGCELQATMGKKGKMLSVVGMEKDLLEKLCAQVRTQLGGDTVCQVANELFPKGNVVAGHASAIELLAPLAKKNGARIYA